MHGCIYQSVKNCGVDEGIVEGTVWRVSCDSYSSYSSYHQISCAQDQILEKRQIDKYVKCRHVQAMVLLIVGVLKRRCCVIQTANFYSHFSVVWVTITNNSAVRQFRLS